MTVIVIKDCHDVMGIVIVRQGETNLDALNRWVAIENERLTSENPGLSPDDLTTTEGFTVEDFEVTE